jgi:phage shock protein C
VTNIHATFAAQGLVRPRDGRVLAGVVAGLGRRFGIDPWPARLLFVLLLMVVPGSQILIYPVLWILMPAEGTVAPAPGAPLPAGPVPAGPPPTGPTPPAPPAA